MHIVVWLLACILVKSLDQEILLIAYYRSSLYMNCILSVKGIGLPLIKRSSNHVLSLIIKSIQITGSKVWHLHAPTHEKKASVIYGNIVVRVNIAIDLHLFLFSLSLYGPKQYTLHKIKFGRFAKAKLWVKNATFWLDYPGLPVELVSIIKNHAHCPPIG